MKKKIKYYLWKFGILNNIKPPQLYKEKLIRKYGKDFGINELIETGTYLGETINALKNDFIKIVSVELDKELVANARWKFRYDYNIKIYGGDSGNVLKEILLNVTKPSLFWLDAHYSEGKTARGKLDTPIVKELKLIFQNSKNHVVLIDDMDNFGIFNSIKEDYPSQKEIKELMPKDSYFYIKNNIGRIFQKRFSKGFVKSEESEKHKEVNDK